MHSTASKMEPGRLQDGGPRAQEGPWPPSATPGSTRGRAGLRGTGDARGPLTFSKPVLEVGVTPPFTVEVDAVPNEEGTAHARGDGAIPAHHLRSTGAYAGLRQPAWQRLAPTDRSTPATRSRLPPVQTEKAESEDFRRARTPGASAAGCPRQCLRGSAWSARADGPSLRGGGALLGAGRALRWGLCVIP